MNEFRIILSIFNLTSLVFSASYSWQIYLAPSPHGFTFVSVMAGTSYLISSVMTNTLIFWHFNQINLTNLILIPVISLAIAGGPMVAGQVLKKIREDKKNDELINDDGNLDQ